MHTVSGWFLEGFFVDGVLFSKLYKDFAAEFRFLPWMYYKNLIRDWQYGDAAIFFPSGHSRHSRPKKAMQPTKHFPRIPAIQKETKPVKRLSKKL